MIETKMSKNIGRPVKVLYKGKWRKIIWEPSIIVNGKVLGIQDILYGGKYAK